MTSPSASGISLSRKERETTNRPRSSRERAGAQRMLGGGEVLRGLRVANFGWFWGAPMLGHLFADMGAEVIRAETWTNVDKVRTSSKAMTDTWGESYFFHNVMRSQRSVSLDLTQPGARSLALDLVRQSDVVVENFRAGVFDRLGLGYPEMRRARPDVVMLSLSAFGQYGPLKTATGFGSNLATFTGMDGLQGYGPDQPRSFAIASLDPFNGVLGAYAVLAALRHRALTGEGQYIDVAQAESTMAMFGAPMLDYVMNQRVHQPMANRDLAMAPHGVYPCKPVLGNHEREDDTWLAIAVASEQEWRGFCAALGNPGWSREPRFADAFRRLRCQDEMDERIAEWTRQRDCYEAAFLLQRHGVMAFPALSGRQLYTDPHLRERESWVEVEHPYGRETLYGVHWKFGETPGRVRHASPVLGQDNLYVFQELLGMPEAQAREMEARRVMY